MENEMFITGDLLEPGVEYNFRIFPRNHQNQFQTGIDGSTVSIVFDNTQQNKSYNIFSYNQLAEEITKWIEPSGSQDAYPLDAKVSHKDKKWISTIDNNVWEPGVYGWAEYKEEQ